MPTAFIVVVLSKPCAAVVRLANCVGVRLATTLVTRLSNPLRSHDTPVPSVAIWPPVNPDVDVPSWLSHAVPTLPSCASLRARMASEVRLRVE